MRRHLARPGDLGPDLLDALRYVVSFARLTQVRNREGRDVTVADVLTAHRERVVDALQPRLGPREDGLWPAVRALPELVRATRAERARLLGALPLDRDSLEAEVTHRQLVIAAGGGGGGGYGYAGAYTLLHRRGVQPELLAGTSIGALLSMFRAKTRIFDGAPLVAAARRLKWNTIFRVMEMENRYGLPATLRLYLRSALGTLFEVDGRPMTLADTQIPLLIAVTGITVEALKHDLSYYEHFLDDVVSPGKVSRVGRLRRIGRWVTVLREFLSEPEALKEVVFGADELTRQVDVLDAAGFSAAVPGVIHYDVLRDDQRTRRILDQLYGDRGITRLTEGGLVDNLPARAAYAEVMKGRITRRNPFVLAMDCFSPKPSSLGFYAIQQLVRPNVQANLKYAHLYLPLTRRLSPMNLVPSVRQVSQAMRWTAEDLEPHMPFIEEMLRPIRVLPDA